jgi:hypothetical protein
MADQADFRRNGQSDYRAGPRPSRDGATGNRRRCGIFAFDYFSREIAASGHTVLFAFYEVAPVTFDIAWLLAAADVDRRRRGLESIHVVIAPGRYQGVRRESNNYEAAVPPLARHERITSISLTHACSCRAVPGSPRLVRPDCCAPLSQHVFPRDYELVLPSFPTSRVCLEAARRGEGPIAVLRASAERRDNVQRWL